MFMKHDMKFKIQRLPLKLIKGVQKDQDYRELNPKLLPSGNPKYWPIDICSDMLLLLNN